jgi:hypothetical protein
MSERQIEIKFEHKKNIIVPKRNQLLYSSYFYNIYATQFTEFYAKVYKLDDEDLNVEVANSFLRISNLLLQVNHLTPKIHGLCNAAPLRAFLIDSYSNDFAELLQRKYFATHYDLLKMFYQIAMSVKNLAEQKIEGVFIAPQSVIVDNHMNFKLANLDINLNNDQIRVLVNRSEFYVYQFAPEFTSGENYTIQSNIWDLGLLVYTALSGAFANVDYESKTIYLNDQILAKSKIGDFVRKMIDFKPKNRPKIDDVLKTLTQLISETIEPMGIKNVVVSSRSKENMLFAFENQMNHAYYDNFTGNTFMPKKGNWSISDALGAIMATDLTLNEAVLGSLVKDGYTNPEKHISLYQEIKEILDQGLPKAVSMCKLLIALHTYIFRSSRFALVAFMKDGKTNALDAIIGTIHAYFSKMNETLIVNYSNFLLSKVQFHFKHIELIENNYSFGKVWLYQIWPRLLSGRFITDALNHFCYTFSLFNAYKRFKFNYFTKNILLFLAKELVNQFALLANVVSLLIYVAYHARLPEQDNAIVNRLIDHLIEVLDNHITIFNVTIEEIKKQYPTHSISSFYLKILVATKFAWLRKRITAKAGAFDLSNFIKHYANVIIRMPESNEKIKKKLTPQLEEQGRSATLGLKTIRELISIVKEEQFVSQYMFGKNGSARIVMQLKMSEDEYDEEYPEDVDDGELIDLGLNDSNPENREMKPTMIPMVTHEMYIQTDPIDDGLEPEEEEEVLYSKPEMKKDPSNSKLKKNPSNGNLQASQVEENFDSIEGLEKFLMKAFARSVDEWIIDFNELKFDSLIATGSTCNVYRGSYKNQTVAIKKLTKPEGESKIKFLKEFKRELSLLVSIPNHSSLLTLMGFCIKDHEVYLVSDFCDGGTLFDLLYKKSTPVKFN